MASEDGKVEGYTRKGLKARAERIGVPEVVAEALEHFDCSAEAMDPQRRAILAAKNFRAGNQWPDAVRQERQGASALQGIAAKPARPCLTIDRVSAPVRQVSNVAKQSNFSIETLPVGGGADKDTAEIFNGWIRRVQNESRGDQPIEWAADGAAEGGLGWFRISTYFTDTDPKFPFDQDARLERVPNCLSVYPDPHANKPTRSDMRKLLVTEDLSKEEFRERWPKAKMASYDAFEAEGDSGGWVTKDSVRIAEFWRCIWTPVRVVELNNGLALEGDDIPDSLKKGDNPTDIRRERTRYDTSVKWSKITACEELESTDWPGTKIPFVPVLGEELNVDGQTKLRGVIEPAMDAQRMLNYTFSAAVESAALAPKAPFIYAAGQTERYKALWQSAATTNYHGLPYDPVSVDGSLVPPPQRNVAEQPIQAFVQLMAASEEAIKATTTVFDPSLGNSNPRERSGEAIKALQTQSEFGNSNYQANVARAMTYCGELLVELGPKLLDRPGRIFQILQVDQTPKPVMLGQAHTDTKMGPQAVQGPDGQPITDPEVARLMGGMVKFYDLKAGKYSVTVTVGRDHATRRQEESAALGELIPHLPPPMQATLTPEYIETLDFTDSKKIADIARRSLPPEMQQAISGEQPQLPPQVAAQLQQIPQLHAALQQAKQIIDTKKVEKDAKLQQTKLEGTKDLLLAHVNNAAKILIAHITAAKEPGNPAEEAALEKEATALDQAHQNYQDAAQRAHDFRMSQLEHAQTLEQAAQEHAHALQQGAQDTESQLRVQAAQPEPAAPEGAGA